ncbi:MAG: hypothetical protein KGQ41_06015 [Alphaproteobacteria bacterium]|nr:hypothetical protein [Alphaproteobacteria bacterium]
MMVRASRIAILVAALALSACQTTGATPKSAMAKSDSKIAGAMADAARDAANSGKIGESLAINEKLYRSDPNNQSFILAYARDLRRAGKVDDARLVIRTPALSPDATASMQTEAAMVLIADGDYKEALTFAEKAVDKDATSPDALQAQALALSGLGRHAEAEDAFTKAYTLWPQARNKTSVINNLAMSQAAQGKVDEANKTMALATGEALRSEVYQNNRAYLKILRDTNVSENVTMPATMPAMKVANVTSDDLKDEPVISMKPAHKPETEAAAQPEKTAMAEPVKQDVAEKVATAGKMKPVLEIQNGQRDDMTASFETPASIEPAAGTPRAPETGGMVATPVSMDTQASGPTPLFEKSDLLGIPYKSHTGFMPHNNETRRRFGMNN